MSDLEVRPSDDYDSPWKEVIERYFPAFLEFFFPHAHRDIDWSRPYEFLDKELMEVVREAEIGTRFVDKLVKVWRRSGDEVWVLIHIEIQNQVEHGFPKRMYIYNYRLFDRYERPIASLAVPADPHANWRPDRFEYEIWGSHAGLRFPVVKLRDFASRWDELEASVNPFAPVVMAHLKTQETRSQPEQRMTWKLRIVRGLYERGFTRKDVLELFRVIDWMMALPAALDQHFNLSLQQYEGEKAMRYVTSIERIQRQIEREEGELIGLRKAIAGALLVKFQRVPDPVRASLDHVTDSDALLRLHQAAVRAVTLEEFQAELPTSEG